MIFITILAYYGVISSCTSKIEIVEKTNPISQRILNDTIVVVAEGTTIIIPDEVWDSIIKFYFLEYEGIEVEFSDVYLDTEEQTAFISINGFNSDGESRVLCIDLIFDQGLGEYHLYQMNGKNTCTGENCSQCKYKKSTGCLCIGDAIDPSKPSGCNHTSVTGGNAVTVGTFILAIIKFCMGLE